MNAEIIELRPRRNVPVSLVPFGAGDGDLTALWSRAADAIELARKSGAPEDFCVAADLFRNFQRAFKRGFA